MTQAAMPGATTERAPAKVNLALHVRARMADGYHALETLFAFTDFGDVLHADPAKDWALSVSGPMAGDVGDVADNLVLRAARAFAAASDWQSRLQFSLDKQIPVAAGLGGGSADAAAALRLMNRLAGFPLDAAALTEIAYSLGADVPACLQSRTAIGAGRGERLTPGPSLERMPVLLLNPGVSVPTGPVFAGWDGRDRGPLGADWRAARNDLTPSAVALQPVIADALDWLSRLPGVCLVRMSGSGATCLALFEDAVPDVDVPNGWWAKATRLI